MEQPTSQETALMKQLKTILLQEDRQEIDSIKNTLYNKKELEKEVNPIVEERIQYIKEHFPEEFGKQVNMAIEEKLEESKEQLLAVISPVMGQMIRKYINYQFQMLKDRIDSQVKSTFSTKAIIGQIKSRVLGIRSSDMVLSDLDKPIIEEVYVIQADSGLLIGSFSRSETVDKDMIAGMLTAIKSFAQDAFQRTEDELDLIEYGSYKILIQSFHTYYMAVALTGSLSAKERDELSEFLMKFAADEMDVNLNLITSKLNKKVSGKLETHFNKDIF